MKLYTRPRSTVVLLLRTGDQIATMVDGTLIESPTVYVDLDIAEAVVWSVVHDAHDSTEEEDMCTLAHTRGIKDVPGTTPVIMREVIELDPWTYVKS